MPSKKNGKPQEAPPAAIVVQQTGGGPTEQLEVDIEGMAGDGHRQMARTPMLGQEDLYITGGRPAGFNVPKELMHGSDRPEEYLARTEVSEDEIGNYVRVQGLMMAFTFGLVDLDHVFKSKFNLRMSLSRKSREETVEVAKAEKKFASRMTDRLMGRDGGNGRGQLGGGQL
jgi:hypothetical protein